MDVVILVFYKKRKNMFNFKVIPFPTAEELALNTALPNVSFPSDHISVVADLKWKHGHVNKEES